MNLEQLFAARDAFFDAHGTAPTVLKLSQPEWQALRNSKGVTPLLQFNDYSRTISLGGLRIEICETGWSLE
jgi:hypothetical protein